MHSQRTDPRKYKDNEKSEPEEKAGGFASLQVDDVTKASKFGMI